MATHPLTAKYPPGSTHRITVSTVREDVCDFDTEGPENLFRFWREIIATQPDYEPDKETLVVVLMTSRLRPYAWHRVSLGTVNECSAHPREIMRPVIAGGAYAFALMHNHPSGDPSPSKADLEVTRTIRECADLFQVRLLDHVIAGDTYYSFRESCLI
jgi:DNA repair protein RadC